MLSCFLLAAKRENIARQWDRSMLCLKMLDKKVMIDGTLNDAVRVKRRAYV